jgi:hypothetical protein
MVMPVLRMALGSPMGMMVFALMISPLMISPVVDRR